MICRDGYHIWQWTSSSTDSGPAPLHLRCQCRALTRADDETIQGLRAQLDAALADRATLEARVRALEAAITTAVSALYTHHWNSEPATKQQAWEVAMRTLQDALAPPPATGAEGQAT